MKTVLLVLGFGVVFSLFCFSGCTRIETPVKADPGDSVVPGERPPVNESAEPLGILPETIRILDTEPIVIEARGGTGAVLWDSEPHFEGIFSPETGRSVLLTPPDLSSSSTFSSMTITITASDENNGSARAEAVITDQGGPPDPGEILINELAWAGTLTSSYDEYIELVNTGARPFYLKDWSIDNAAGSGKPLSFSGRIDGSSLFLIANYAPESGKSAIEARVNRADTRLSLSNSAFGPFVLRDGEGQVFDRAGDGGPYRLGLNNSGVRASTTRFSSSRTTDWDEASWYTEGLSLNLSDGTFGTPGAHNSDTPYSTGASPGPPPGPEDNGGDARALITKFFVDARDEIGEDWVELFITAAGNVKNFMVTDLDGTDFSISNGFDAFVEEGERILVVWGKTPGRSGSMFFVQDQGPTATRDELVLFCGAERLDGLCYSTDGKLPDDYANFVIPASDGGFGWEGDPIRSAYGTRLSGQDGSYVEGRGAVFWSTDTPPIPGSDAP